MHEYVISTTICNNSDICGDSIYAGWIRITIDSAARYSIVCSINFPISRRCHLVDLGRVFKSSVICTPYDDSRVTNNCHWSIGGLDTSKIMKTSEREWFSRGREVPTLLAAPVTTAEN